MCYQETAKLGHEPAANSGWVIEAFFAPEKMPVFNVCGGLLKAINERTVKGISKRYELRKNKKKKLLLADFPVLVYFPVFRPSQFSQTPETQLL